MENNQMEYLSHVNWFKKKSIKFVSKMVTTLICLFIVMQKRVMKYMTRIGQNTGMLKTWKKVQQKAITWNQQSALTNFIHVVSGTIERDYDDDGHRGLGRRVPELELWQTPIRIDKISL